MNFKLEKRERNILHNAANLLANEAAMIRVTVGNNPSARAETHIARLIRSANNLRVVADGRTSA